MGHNIPFYRKIIPKLSLIFIPILPRALKDTDVKFSFMDDVRFSCLVDRRKIYIRLLPKVSEKYKSIVCEKIYFASLSKKNRSRFLYYPEKIEVVCTAYHEDEKIFQEF